MTYDDGPHGTHTPRLLDMLKQRGIKATFFVVGQCAAEFPAIMKRIVAEGHEVASHSWSHPNLSSMGDDNVRSQLQRTHDTIISTTGGVAPRTMRPPYGAFTERQRKWCHAEFGYKCILWDVDSNDWRSRNATKVHAEIMRMTRPGSIILTHDIHKSTIDAMPQTLDDLTAKGFKFVTVSELLAMDRPRPKAPPKPAAPAPAADPGTPTSAPAPETTAAPAPSAAPASATTGTR
jgi:peptidoglycan/xylan/chitin deacetylase (PgdA/CDA1 family)